MLALISLFKTLREKEHFLRTRYHREHPHFLLYIALDAIVSVLIVGGSYGFATHAGWINKDPHLTADLGVEALDLAGVKQQALSHGITFYWIGELDTDSYSTEVLRPGRVALNYLDSSLPEVSGDKRLVSVIYYERADIFMESEHEPINPEESIQSFNGRGDLLTYNRSDLTSVAVTLADHSKIVVLRYPKQVSESRLFDDSERITPLVF